MRMPNDTEFASRANVPDSINIGPNSLFQSCLPPIWHASKNQKSPKTLAWHGCHACHASNPPCRGGTTVSSRDNLSNYHRCKTPKTPEFIGFSPLSTI